MAKIAVGPARPASARVQGIESLVEDLTLHNGKKLELELGIALSDNPRLKRTIYGADSIEIEVFDPERRLLRHSLAAEKWDVELDGLKFRYPGGITKAGDNLTLTLENRWIALLREATGPKRVARGDGPKQMTRAEFIKMLVEEACGKRLRFHCPQLHVKQPIKSVREGKRAKAEAKENRGRGLGDVSSLTVKGAKADPEQREIVDRALRVAEHLGAPFRVQIALVVALIAESECRNWSGGHSSSVGVLQLLDTWGTKSQRMDVERSVDLFLTEGFTGEGGALDIYRRSSGLGAAQIATRVQGNRDGASSYSPWESEAREWVEAYDGESGSITVTEPYEFVVEKDQSYWEAIKELARKVNWRAFIVADVFYYMPEPELLQSAVRLAIDGELLSAPESGVENVDFEYDGNDPVTEIEIQALVRQWKTPPASVVTLADHGPASIGFGDAPVKADKKGQKTGLSSNRKAATGEGRARYLVSTIEVPLADDPAQRMATIKAHRATPPLPEPAPNTRRLQQSAGAGASANALAQVTIANASPGPPGWGGSAALFKQFIHPFMEERGLSPGGEKEQGHSSTGDHDPEGQPSGYATDYSTNSGEAIARELAAAMGNPNWSPNTYDSFIVEVDGYRFEVQILWGDDIEHGDHIHVGAHRV